MSIIQSYDANSAAILEPAAIFARQEGFPALAVSTFHRETVDRAAARHGGNIIGEMASGMAIPIYEISCRGQQVALYHAAAGGAASAALMEEMIARGGKRFVFFGACGTLDQALCDGRLVVPTAAYRDEGTSYHYLPAGDYIDIPTASRLALVMEELGLPHVAGRTWTTDGIFRETRDNMLARRAEGCIVVEMECASLMAVGQFRGVETYQFLFGGDNLDAPAWEERDLRSLPADARDRYAEIALEIACKL